MITPSAASLPLAQVSALVRAFAGRDACWKVTNSFGSMLLFDFGDHVPIRTSRGRLVEVGQTTLSVLDCAWTFKHGRRKLFDSDTVSRSDSPALTEALLGASLVGLERSQSSAMRLRFSTGPVLIVDLTNRYGSDDDILEIKLRNLFYLKMSPAGEFSAEAVLPEAQETERLSA